MSATVNAFMQLSLDGYFADEKSDMSFAHRATDDAEWQDFVKGNATGKSTLLFGRVTFEMMAAFWPSPMAAAAMPEVAAGMNAAPKVVFSKTLQTATWSNTTIGRDLVAAVTRLKSQSPTNMTVLGSGTIVTQLVDADLLDTLQIVINPIALGAGRSLFAGLQRRVNFRLTKSRAFRNGAVVLWYARA